MSFYKVPQLAQILGVRRDTVSGWIRRGELAAFNVGKGGRAHYRVSQKALDDFQQARAVRPRAKIVRRRPQSVPDYLAS